MFKKLKNLIRKIKNREELYCLKATGEVVKLWEHRWWGDNIHWEDFNKRELCWISETPMPELGMIVQAKMDSGKIAEFMVIGIKWCQDPPDMFFVKLVDIGYVGEKPANPYYDKNEKMLKLIVDKNDAAWVERIMKQFPKNIFTPNHLDY